MAARLGILNMGGRGASIGVFASPLPFLRSETAATLKARLQINVILSVVKNPRQLIKCIVALRTEALDSSLRCAPFRMTVGRFSLAHPVVDRGYAQAGIQGLPWMGGRPPPRYRSTGQALSASKGVSGSPTAVVHSLNCFDKLTPVSGTGQAMSGQKAVISWEFGNKRACPVHPAGLGVS